MATILVTGHEGYIGTVLTDILAARGHTVRGLDVGYYRDCVVGPFQAGNRPSPRDVRDVTTADLDGVDAVVHLAGLSNDPLGELAPGITEAINFEGTLRLARAAREAGVSRFVYASSQSMYGISEVDEELDEDRSAKNPVTAYARTKWDAEVALRSFATDTFTVVMFRPSTVFGVSPRLRCDIVFNSMVACAYTTGRVEVKSDGTPWRPVVHVRDVCAAFMAGLDAPASLVANRSFNVGIPNGNYSVRDLAEAASRAVPGSTVVYTGEHGKDSRTYRVSFARILTELSDYYQPAWDLDRGGEELVGFFRQTGFNQEQFRGRATNRLAQLKHLAEIGRLDSSLRWSA